MKFFDPIIIKTFSKKKYLDVFPKLKDARIQRITEISLTFIAIPIFGIFAISPTLITIAELQRRLPDNQLVYSKLRQKNANLNSLQINYSKIQKDLPFIEAALPKDQKPTLFIAEIQGLAKKYTIILDGGIQISKIELFGPLKYSSENFLFTLSGSGSYGNVLTFINAVTNFNRVTTIDTIVITRSSEKQSAVQLNLTGKAYFKK